MANDNATLTEQEFLKDVLEMLSEFGREIHVFDPSGFEHMCFGWLLMDDEEIRQKVVPWLSKKYFNGVTPMWMARITDETGFGEILTSIHTT